MFHYPLLKGRKGTDVKFAEDLSIGAVTDCGTATFERDDIIHFASQYDPQPFHLNDEDAKHALFGALTASGVHTAAAGTHRVLTVAMREVCYLGSPGTTMLKLHKPVYAGTTIRVEHKFKTVDKLDGFPGVAVATGLTLAFDLDGEPIMTLEDVCWIGSRQLSPSADLPSRLGACAAAALGMLPVPAEVDFTRGTIVAPADGRICFEDVPEGTTFVSDWLELDAGEIARFHAAFDGEPGLNASPGTADAACANRVNHWLNVGLATRMMAEVFWNRAEVVGGGGMVGPRWPTVLRPGDRFRAIMTVAEARRLRSRPNLGLIGTLCTCVNEDNQVLSMLQGMPFIRTRHQ